jgi:hypothetical protein
MKNVEFMSTTAEYPEQGGATHQQVCFCRMHIPRARLLFRTSFRLPTADPATVIILAQRTPSVPSQSALTKQQSHEQTNHKPWQPLRLAICGLALAAPGQLRPHPWCPGDNMTYSRYDMSSGPSVADQ